jgi:hypothetical protein
VTAYLVELVVRLSLAILLIANGQANAFAHCHSSCSCSVEKSDGVNGEEAPAKRSGCSCCRNNPMDDNQEPSSESSPQEDPEKPSGKHSAPFETAVEASCPGCPYCPDGCCTCTVCKPPSHHILSCFTVELAYVGSSSADVAALLPPSHASELLQVPRI